MSDKDEKLAAIFRIVLDLPDDSDVTGLRKVTTRSWDSLATVSLAFAIESEFGLRLDAADNERLTSFEAARLLVEEKAG